MIGMNELLSVATFVGTALIVAPTVAALIAAFRRPLLFPVVVRVKG
jgi:hypothetical protein